ncbi:MAG: carbohydrate kinase family protein [Candidatus Helarchaeota archaeon]|nr:carbohydrate kinase family protein [Candidatus Helarchaeota archaeon]
MGESILKSPELITIGHILLDLRAYVEKFPVPDISVKIKGQIQYTPGGSATNVAVAAARLGVKSSICSILGFDDYGMNVIKQLLNERVDVSNIKIDYHKPTGISLVIVNEEGEPIIIQSLGANEPFPISYLNLPAIIQAKHLHMTGTDLTALREAARIAKHSSKGNVMVSFDPGRSKSHLGYQKLEPILENIDYLIINRTESARMLGHPEEPDIIKVINELKSVLPKDITLIVKGGSKETIVKSNNEFFKVPPYKVKVYDTIGAGDAFAAGIINALLQNKSMKDAILNAHACAGYKIQYGGAQSSPTTEQLAEFLAAHKNEISAQDI